MRKVKFKVVRKIGERRKSAFTRGNYSLDYPENSIVKARKGTLGIAVFRTRKQAREFLEKSHGFYLFFKTIRVCPIGRGKTVKYICDYPSEPFLDKFYSCRRRRDSFFRLAISPPGTMFYPAVEVLD